MNLTEALDAALPDIPQVRLSRSRPPRLDPELIVHEYVLDGEPIIGILQRENAAYFRFPPWQWQLANLFDGERSYEQIAEAFFAETGMSVDAEDVRGFAESLGESGLWYKSQQEKNLAMREKLVAQRGRRTKSKINIAHISFSAWDPDRYLGWVDRNLGQFIYSRWCLLVVLTLFAFETVVVVQNWKVIGPDTALFFNFSQKSLGDIVEFWLLIFVIGFFHETAHGLTCKHFGGQVHSMGLMFLYLVPCFFVDVTESWVSATRVQRLGTIIAGIWIELMMCGVAMIFWLNSAQGSGFHNFMYEIILLTGIAAVAINLNPLIKLDGYYFLTEIIEIPELKERSTAFLSAWVQAKILRLNIEVPIVPRRRVALFVIYAIASGAYSYLLLLFVVRLSYRLGSKWFAEFALIPSAALAYTLFKSRLKALRLSVVEFWKQNFQPGYGLRPSHFAIASVVVALFFVPLWRDRQDGFYVIEPGEAHTICAGVPGRIMSVMVGQGERVHAGQPLLKMTSPQAASMRSAALAQTGSARFRNFDAQLQGQSVGTGVADQVAAQRMTTLADEAQSQLVLSAPRDGIVVTDDPSLLQDENVAIGQPLIELAEGARIARVFIPTTAFDRISRGSEVVLAIPGRFSMVRLKLPSPDGEPVALPAGLLAKEKFQGIRMPVFYTVRVVLPAESGNPMYGLAGTAKIFGMRRSLAGRAAMVFTDLMKAHVW
jgi:putative peptide zinc metalloprotease protein